MTAFDLSPEAARRALAGNLPSGAPDDDAAALERYAVVVWSHLTEPGDGVAGRLVAQLGALSALRLVMGSRGDETGTASDDELLAGRKRWMPRLTADATSHALRVAAVTGITILTRADPEWPVQLDDLGDHAPLCLWVRGDPAKLRMPTPGVALVGARAATSYGEHVTLELAADLAGGGIPVVSGGAYGIDGAAHRAAIAAGGLTIALLAGGADRAYPAGHTELISRIAHVGVVASEAPCGSAPTKWRFLQRNRLIAALSSATVVVEAGWRSGSLNTAAHAVSLSRRLGAVPGPITSAASAGTHRLHPRVRRRVHHQRRRRARTARIAGCNSAAATCRATRCATADGRCRTGARCAEHAGVAGCRRCGATKRHGARRGHRHPRPAAARG